MNYFAQAVSEINDDLLYKKLPIKTTDDLAIDSQLISLEEVMSLEIEKHNAVLSKMASISMVRHSIIDDANQLMYTSAEEKLTEALVMCSELFSMEDVGQSARKEYVLNIDVKDHQLIKTYSAEAINFIDAAINVGKLIIKKIIEFILYLYRLINGIVRRMFGKNTSKRKITYSLVAPSKKQPSQSSDLAEESDEFDEGNQDTCIEFSIPTEYATTLWDYTNKELMTNGRGLLGIIRNSRVDLCYVLHSTFMGLTNCTLNDYYSIVSYIFRGVEGNIKSEHLREITSPKGIARMKAVEVTINKAYSDCLNIPSNIEGKVIYPGVMFSTPNYKKSNSMSTMIKVIETDKSKAAKAAATSKFSINSADELMNLLAASFDLVNVMSDISDECESRVSDIQKRLEEIVEVSNSEDGRKNFFRFYENDSNIRKTNPADFVSAYNASILNNLRLITKQQLDIINAVANLTSGIDDGRSDGILKMAMNEYNSIGVEFKIKSE